jgi:hypothetical protein
MVTGEDLSDFEVGETVLFEARGKRGVAMADLHEMCELFFS